METIDVRGLPEEQAMLIYEFVEFLKLRMKEQKEMESEKEGKKQKITFAVWPLGVKGELTREEIYDYL